MCESKETYQSKTGQIIYRLERLEDAINRLIDALSSGSPKR